jgi:hypothetical protein
MNGSRYYRVRVAGAKYGVGCGTLTLDLVAITTVPLRRGSADIAQVAFQKLACLELKTGRPRSPFRLLQPPRASRPSTVIDWSLSRCRDVSRGTIKAEAINGHGFPFFQATQ